LVKAWLPEESAKRDASALRHRWARAAPVWRARRVAAAEPQPVVPGVAAGRQPEVPDAVAVPQPVVPGAAEERQPAVRGVVVARQPAVRGVVVVRRPAARGARRGELPLAVASAVASACHPDRALPSELAPQPAARSARAMTTRTPTA
jgi:hypothetical protein